MIGRSTASLGEIPRRWVQGWWGALDIDTRMKWTLLWPTLRELPRNGVRLLDAGCGTGRWALELAARRPGWSVVGVDRDTSSIEKAESSRAQLGLGNVSFLVEDFLSFDSGAFFDAVLSVASAHYLAADGKGDELFRRMRSWLRPGGVLVLLAPRKLEETCFCGWLPRPYWRAIFSVSDLERYCQVSNFDVEQLNACIGRLGTLAGQLDAWAVGSLRLFLPVLYPIKIMLAGLDSHWRRSLQERSLMLLLVARARQEGDPVIRPRLKE